MILLGDEDMLKGKVPMPRFLGPNEWTKGVAFINMEELVE